MASDTETDQQQHRGEEDQELARYRSTEGGEVVIENGHELPLRPTTPIGKPTTGARPPQAQPISPSSNAGSSDNDNLAGSISADISQDDDGDASSKLVTSPLVPSVTSPPYWAHGHSTNNNRGLGTRHVRTMSSVSAESDLPLGAITLQDNEHDDGPDGANVYGRDRNRACWAKKVDIVDHILVNGGTANIGAFVVWNIRVETLNVRIHPTIWTSPRLPLPVFSNLFLEVGTNFTLTNHYLLNYM